MHALKRLLKPAFLEGLLSQALAVAPAGTGLSVMSDGTRLATAGPTVGAGFTPGQDLTFALCLDGTCLGHLAVHPRPGAPAGELILLKNLGQFLSGTCGALIEQEHAKRQVVTETLDKYREIELLHRATLSLNRSLMIRDVARALLAECQRANLPVDMGMVFIRPAQSEAYQPVDSFGPTGPIGAADLALLAESPLFQEVFAGTKGEIINDLAADPRWRDDVPGLKALLLVPLRSPAACVGCLVLAATSPRPFQAAHLKRISTIASVAGISLGNAYHFEGMQNLMDALLQALAAAIDARDPYTSGHSQRVAALSVELARLVNEDTVHFPDVSFSEAEIHEIFYGGLLHDVGKIGVREPILTKNSRLPAGHIELIGLRLSLRGRLTGEPWTEIFERLQRLNRAGRLNDDDLAFITSLSEMEFTAGDQQAPLINDAELLQLTVRDGNLTPEERREIERHPDESFRILQHIPFTTNFSRLLTMIQQHHERLDGSGYPARLAADEIILQSRILAITDIFDAITQERHYKPALERNEALKVLNQESGRGRIDPRLTELFANNIETIEKRADNLRRDSGARRCLWPPSTRLAAC